MSRYDPDAFRPIRKRAAIYVNNGDGSSFSVQQGKWTPLDPKLAAGIKAAARAFWLAYNPALAPDEDKKGLVA